MNTGTIIQGDAIETLMTLPGGSIDLQLSDIPSGETQAPFDKRANLSQLIPEGLWRLTPSGSMVLMASHFTFACAVMDQAKDYFRYEIIWRKGRPTGFLNAKKRPLKAHEYILVLGRPEAYFKPQKSTGHARMHTATQKSAGANYNPITEPTTVGGETDRYYTTVLDFSCIANNDASKIHPQQKPVPLLRWLIRSYCPPGGRVVDPYAGSGSTVIAAQAEGCDGLGIESDPEFVVQARNWIEKQ